jgi:hypothetical protein
MKGVNHYLKDGTKHKGGMHKMSDGTPHTGKSHTSKSVKLFHYGELTKKSQMKARKSWKT